MITCVSGCEPQHSGLPPLRHGHHEARLRLPTGQQEVTVASWDIALCHKCIRLLYVVRHGFSLVSITCLRVLGSKRLTLPHSRHLFGAPNSLQLHCSFCELKRPISCFHFSWIPWDSPIKLLGSSFDPFFSVLKMFWNTAVQAERH